MTIHEQDKQGYRAVSCPKYKSLDFPVNRFFMKLFNNSNIQMVNDCQVYFGFDLPSVIIGRQSKKLCPQMLHILFLS